MARRLALAVRLDGSARMPGGRSLKLMFLVSGRVERRRLEPILDRIVAILRDTHAEPEPPATEIPEASDVPPPPPARRSWWSRRFSKD